MKACPPGPRRSLLPLLAPPLLALAACAPQDAAPRSGGDVALAAPVAVAAEAQSAPEAVPGRPVCFAGSASLGCEPRSALGLQELPEPLPYRGAP